MTFSPWPSKTVTLAPTAAPAAFTPWPIVLTSGIDELTPTNQMFLPFIVAMFTCAVGSTGVIGFSTVAIAARAAVTHAEVPAEVVEPAVEPPAAVLLLLVLPLLLHAA